MVAQNELDHENPMLNDKMKKDRVKKLKGKNKIGANDTPTLSRWPGDVSNTFQQYTNKTTTQSNSIINYIGKYFSYKCFILSR